MGKTREVFTTPVGRLVQGDCFEAQTKDQQGNLRVVKQGPNAGQPNPTYFVGVAFPKADPNNPAQPNAEFGAFYGLLERVARAEWPALFPNPNGPCVNPNFAFKVIDGDGLDRNGKSNATKEGFAGHWVVRFASAYAPKVVRPTAPGVWEQVTDKTAVKRGYYVRVAGSATGNDNTQNPGLYVNLDMIELVAYGQEIVSGPDAATAFGQPVALPPGASAVPMGQPGMPVGGLPAVPGATPGNPAMGLPAVPGGPGVATPSPAAALPATASPAAVPAYTGYMGVPGATPGAPAVPGNPAVGVQAVSSLPHPGAAGVPSVPVATPSPTRVMTAAANGQPYESFIAGGWTDDLLIAHGYMVVQ